MTAFCAHCLLPLGRGRHDAQVAGEDRCFCCYGCCLAFQVAQGESEESDAAWLLIRLGIGAFLSMNIMMFSLLLYHGGYERDFAPVLNWGLFLLATPTVALLGWPFLREAWDEALWRRMGSAALIVLGVAAAYVYSTLVLVAGGDRLYFDTATMVLVLFTLGRYLEAAGRARAMRSIAPMLAPAREWVSVLGDDGEIRMSVRDVRAGMRVLVRPGERIGVDGTVVEGTSHVGEAILTGESNPVPKHPGASVLAGSLNHDGPLVIITHGEGTASRWMAITRAVREALARRGRTGHLAEHVAGAFVPAVLALAVATGLYWARRGPYGEALMHGLAVLVVACPCALALAAPLATSIGIGQLARRGILARGGDVLESLTSVRAVAFDKTGTLTLGEPRITGIASDRLPADAVLALAAALEAQSEHPLARGIRMETERRGLWLFRARNLGVVPGHGVTGEVRGVRAAAGSAAWLVASGFAMSPDLAALAAPLEAESGSLVYVGQGSQIVGVLVLDDPLRPEARDAVAGVQALGLETLLLSGDRMQAARRIATAVGIARVESAMSPEAKQSLVARQGRRWAMVGDGLNDAPTLAAAGVGIAAGSATDLARESGGMVLPEGGLALLPWAIRLSRAVRRTTVANLLWAFGYNAVALALAASGHLLPVLAAALMAGSSLVVVLNSLRLERFPAALPREPAQTGTAAVSSGALARPGSDDGVLTLPLRPIPPIIREGFHNAGH
jgi:P-type Cu2+ transporter